MPKHCAEFRNEPQSVAMQRNLRHLFLAGGHNALPSPIRHFWRGTCPGPCPPRDLRHWMGRPGLHNISLQIRNTESL